MTKFDDSRQLTCSFCGKPQDQVRRLVAGPGVYICDECIALCEDIIREEFAADERAEEYELAELPKPRLWRSMSSVRILQKKIWL